MNLNVRNQNANRNIFAKSVERIKSSIFGVSVQHLGKFYKVNQILIKYIDIDIILFDAVKFQNTKHNWPRHPFSDFDKWNVVTLSADCK